jgi:hypothetical protein
MLRFQVDFTENCIIVTQTPADDNKDIPTYREHHFDLAFFTKEGKILTLLGVKMGAVKTHRVKFDEGLDFDYIIPNYSSIAYVGFHFPKEERAWFNLNVEKFDVNTLSVINTYEFMSCLRGKITVNEYLDFATKLIKNDPKTWADVLCREYFSVLISNTNGMMCQDIKQRIWNKLMRHHDKPGKKIRWTYLRKYSFISQKSVYLQDALERELLAPENYESLNLCE